MQRMIEVLGGADGIAAMARELGVDAGMVEKGAAALLPAVLGGFKQQAAAQPGGLGSLVEMLGQMGGGSLLDAVLGQDPTPVEQGNALLGRIFGSSDVANAVTQHAASQSGVGADLLGKMLPMIAMAAAGFMAKQAAAGPADGGGGLLGSVIGALTGGGQASGGLGNVACLLDMDGDGNPLNDILRMVGR